MKMVVEVEADIDYSVVRGYEATREEPGEPTHIDSLVVRVGGADITDSISKREMEAIEDAALQDWEMAND